MHGVGTGGPVPRLWAGPGIGNCVWDAYEQLRELCQQLTLDTVEAMSSVGEGLRATASNHRKVEDLLEDRTALLDAGLDVVNGGQG